MAAAEEILKRIRSIPPLPVSVTRLMAVVSKPDYRTQEAVRIVETDPVLTANILRAVNSAAMGLRSPVASVARAIDLTGGTMIAALALKGCAGKLYDDPLTGYDTEKGDLWRHSLRAALGARELARNARAEVSPDIAYTAGLLVDIGKAVLSDFLNGTSRKFIHWIVDGEVKDYLEAEQRELGTDHCEVGAQLARSWGLPEPLPSAINFHHRPSLAPESHRPLVGIVHVADTLARMMNAGSGDAMLYPLDPISNQLLSMHANAQLESLLLRVQTEYDKMSKAVGATETPETEAVAG